MRSSASGRAYVTSRDRSAGSPAAPPSDTDFDSAASRARLLAGLSTAIPDILPEAIRADKGLMHRAEAFLAIHDPTSVQCDMVPSPPRMTPAAYGGVQHDPRRGRWSRDIAPARKDGGPI